MTYYVEPLIDPFLMMDNFNSVDPEGYMAGFVSGNNLSAAVGNIIGSRIVSDRGILAHVANIKMNRETARANIIKTGDCGTYR